MAERWRGLSERDRRVLGVSGVFVLGVFLIKGVWLPTQQRLETAERNYHQNLLLAGRMKRASPEPLSRITQPLSRHVSDSAGAAGLDLSALDNDNQQLRVTLKGDAKAVLDWLIRLERDGARVQSLTLEKHGTLLVAKAAWAVES
ncbi:type II secretion system protein GspM [Pseudomonas sp. NPDC088368]|jgi:general secretion pathway protein M|uniref:type II secretion system protein GspM n=1 Tax=Pseudomonas sp. NPDC088368 TaxID=3364453 RepID=UPI00382D5EB3